MRSGAWVRRKWGSEGKEGRGERWVGGDGPAPGRRPAVFWQSYLDARYVAGAGASAVAVRAGSLNGGLDRLLRRHGARQWAFVTAHNPGSRRLRRWCNSARTARLRVEILRAGWRSLPAGAEGPGWPREEGFLLLDAATAKVHRLARRYGQNAILLGRRGTAARLLWCA